MPPFMWYWGETQDFLKLGQALYQLNYSFSPPFVFIGLFGVSHPELININIWLIWSLAVCQNDTACERGWRGSLSNFGSLFVGGAWREGGDC